MYRKVVNTEQDGIRRKYSLVRGIVDYHFGAETGGHGIVDYLCGGDPGGHGIVVNHWGGQPGGHGIVDYRCGGDPGGHGSPPLRNLKSRYKYYCIT